MNTKELEKYASVPPVSSLALDFTIPDGETWDARRFYGSAAYASDVEVSAVWDPAGAGEVIASTHGDAEVPIDFRMVGDGSKVVRLVLDNATANEHTIGGRLELIRVIVPEPAP